jgi:hypothetical protein
LGRWHETQYSMSRISQPEGTRGSLKWIQVAINSHVLDRDLLPMLKGARSIGWRSPLRQDDFAEYRDTDFLKQVGLGELSGALAQYWPQHGPQWDALGVSNRGDVLLVEAKAHVAEICSPATQASRNSRMKIEAALATTAQAFGAKPRAAWTDVFYQLANRLAHLYFLRNCGVPAWLILVNFIGDADMKGPHTAAEWDAAYHVVYHIMGIDMSAALMKNVLHVYPDVSELT